MIVYQNKTIDKVYYGNKRIREVWLGGRKIVGEVFKQVNVKDNYSNSKPLVLKGSDILRPSDTGTVVVETGITDAYGSYAIQDGSIYQLHSTAGIQGDPLPIGYSWSSLYATGEWYEVFSWTDAITRSCFLGKRNGVVVFGFRINYTQHFFQVPDGTVKVTAFDELFEGIRVLALNTSGTLMCGSLKKNDDNNNPYSCVWTVASEDVIDIQENMFLTSDGAVFMNYWGENFPQGVFDTGVRLYPGGHFIHDGHLYNVSLNGGEDTLHKSTETGFTSASAYFALKNGTLWDASDVENMTMFPDLPSNFIELSGSVARTSDDRIFYLTKIDDVKTVIEMSTEVSNA